MEERIDNLVESVKKSSFSSHKDEKIAAARLNLLYRRLKSNDQIDYDTGKTTAVLKEAARQQIIKSKLINFIQNIRGKNRFGNAQDKTGNVRFKIGNLQNINFRNSNNHILEENLSKPFNKGGKNNLMNQVEMNYQLRRHSMTSFDENTVKELQPVIFNTSVFYVLKIYFRVEYYEVHYQNMGAMK